jgi:hypothetical protein
MFQAHVKFHNGGAPLQLKCGTNREIASMNEPVEKTICGSRHAQDQWRPEINHQKRRQLTKVIAAPRPKTVREEEERMTYSL